LSIELLAAALLHSCGLDNDAVSGVAGVGKLCQGSAMLSEGRILAAAHQCLQHVVELCPPHLQ